ncbi:hypothetical protein Q7P37_002910 [Cladosporium fusiforme]
MTTLQKGDLVLVTGATGYIGNHVVEELIASGYHVRGTSRNAGKAKFLVDFINKKFGQGYLEIVNVPDMTDDSAYDEAVKGVDGVVHLASVLTFSAVPNEVIPPTVQATVNILEAIMKEPKVKSLVVTSSSNAALSLVANVKLTITKDTWNDQILEDIRTEISPSPYKVYAASKTEAEKALWKTVKAIKPPFQVATVLPSTNFGHRVRATGNSTGDWPLAIFNGKKTMLSSLPPHYFINVRDDAKLHVIALIDPACNGERLFGFTAPYNLNQVLAVFRKLYPDKVFDEEKDVGEDLTKVPNAEAEELLRKHYGRGFIGFEETIKESLEPADSDI